MILEFDIFSLSEDGSVESNLTDLNKAFSIATEFYDTKQGEMKDSDKDRLASLLSLFAIALLILYSRLKQYELEKTKLGVLPATMFRSLRDKVNNLYGYGSAAMLETAKALIGILESDQGTSGASQLNQQHIDALNVSGAIKESRLHRMAVAIYRARLSTGFCDQVNLSEAGEFVLVSSNQPGSRRPV